jgi:hypothetical protein
VLGTDAGARQQLKAEALKRFDGDYDVLYQPFASEHPDFNQRVSDAVATTGLDGLTMDGLLNRVLMLNLSVPVNIEKWETSTYAPLVVFIPAGFSERTTKQVLAYDQDGKEHWLDAKVAPDFPVVVVGPSERVSSTTEAARRAPYELKSILPGGQPAGVVDDPGSTFETPVDGSGG